jgi:predicted transposase YdaD
MIFQNPNPPVILLFRFARGQRYAIDHGTKKAKAKEMLERFSVQETAPTETSTEGSAIIDLVITAIVYKFSELNRDELLAMLGLELQEPKAFREIREETTRKGIEAILLVRFSEIDEELAAVVPKLMELDSNEYTRLLLNLSRSELLALS